ncbi:hypothetical protein BU17DRAFT_42083 [Hysterangium stoloniferum]|nr:hypothetical protein BU17DRAFT_42083 [Hysterangium stoloniferum]
MAAAARAAARRQAILNSRGDRLAKLTSSARGDDPGGVYVTHDDPPLPTISSGLKDIVGDDAPPPYPAAPIRTSTADTSSDEVQLPDWNSEQQQEFFRALMSGASAGQSGSQGFPPGFPPITGTATDPSAPAAGDPFSALLSSIGGQEGGPFVAAAATPPQPRTLIQKLIPVLHVLSMIALVIWFVAWKEPEEFANTLASTVVHSNEAASEILTGYDTNGIGWKRWARLTGGPASIAGLAIPPLPAFFWAFTTIELLLHSLRLFSEPNAYRPPMLLGLVLPYLPPPFPKAILTSLKYFQMGSLVLDDLAILIFGIGLVVFVSNWRT